MKKNCIVNLVNTTSGLPYLKGQQRLVESLKGNFDGDVVTFVGESSVGAPPHQEVPYGFKVYSLMEMFSKYDNVLWLDASVYAIKSVQPIFDIIENRGYFMQDSGWTVGQITSDAVLDKFDLTRDEVMDWPSYGNAGVLGLNGTNERAILFMSSWYFSMVHGYFQPSVDNINCSLSADPRCKWNRGDMPVGSIIAHKLGMHHNYVKFTDYVQYAAPEEPVYNDTVCLKVQGVVHIK